MPVGKGSIERATNAGNTRISSVENLKAKVPDILTDIPVSQIQPAPESLTSGSSQEKPSKELVQSIKAHGMIEPVIVRRVSDSQFELLSGNKRLQAVREIGMELISSRVIDKLSDTQAREIYRDLHTHNKGNVNLHELKFEAVSAISSELPTYLL